ncbi:DUF4747 family protein [Sphingomonas sp. CBMAI 2297]|uniref:DUF4747 family protein n=1 Tax=Sphingomonas sp. CBMAI 2297 TaxID=2991720 RepID=UPI002458D7FB|nr:DUF4747 family protein [Sphingomonas sp. CBMAI 2297]MDH4746530.1 DUF4747 family protein [Sphingomonas sp. CBMAI 2297]
MARDPKLEVSAINIRIPDTHNRDYRALIERLAGLRRGVRVYGDSYVAIKFFSSDQEDMGIIAKYTEIDIDGDWFDLEDFDTATPERLEEISIPDALRPNLAQFYFQLFPDDHIVAVSTYAESKGLSTRSLLKYFREALSWREISEEFGRVEVDIVQNYHGVEELLALPYLKEVRIIIRRPNSDDVSGDLAAIIEERLKEQNGDEYEEVLRSKDSGDLEPNERTRKLGVVAAENGELRTKSIINGIMTERKASDMPLTEGTRYKPEEPEMVIFQSLAERIRETIARARQALNG